MADRLPVHSLAERIVSALRGKSPLEATTCDYCGDGIEPLRGERDGRRAYCDDECSRLAFQSEH
jgi:hypothetical protein